MSTLNTLYTRLRSFARREPVLARSALATLVATLGVAVPAIVAHVGAQTLAGTVLAALVPLLAGLSARAKVSPTDSGK